MWQGGAHEQLDAGFVCVANFAGGEVRPVAEQREGKRRTASARFDIMAR
jgi:hypothetical protein